MKISAMVLAALLLAPSARAQAPAFVSQFGSFGHAAGEFTGPRGVAVDAGGDVWVADTGDDRVERFTAAGVFVSKFDTGLEPRGIAIAGDGTVYVSASGLVIRYATDGTRLGEWQFSQAWDVAIAIAGDGSVFVADVGNSKVLRFTPAHALLAQWSVTDPTGIAVDGAGDVYVTSGTGAAVLKFTAAGAPLGAWELEATPLRVAASSTGRVFVTLANDRVQEFTAAGALVAAWGEHGSGPGQFDRPEGIAVAPDGSVLVADRGNFRIQRFAEAPTAVATRSWGSLKAEYR